MVPLPEFLRRRSYNRDLTERRYSRVSISQESLSEEEESVLFMLEDDVDSIDFSNTNILNDISDLFTFYKEQINSRLISVLI